MTSKRRGEKYADLLRRLSSPHDNEIINAVHLLIKALTTDGRDLHYVATLVETDEARMQRIFDAGREKGKAEEIEARQRSVVALSAASPFDDGIGEGINGYSWEEVVGHCVLHKPRLSKWERGFVESVQDHRAATSNTRTDLREEMMTA